MTLEKTILINLSKWRPAGQQNLTIHDPDSNVAAVLTADKCDELACRVWEMSVRRNAAENETLACWAERIANCKELPENLAVIEIDAERDEAILRSETPVLKGEHLSYYELLLKGNLEALLQRYRTTQVPGGKREQSHFVLTHEAAAAMIGAIGR